MNSIVLVVVGCIFLTPRIATAHDLIGALHQAQVNKEVAEKLEEIDRYRDLLRKRLRSDTVDRGSEGLVQRLLRWPPGKISVCFFDGEVSQWQKIISIANEWTPKTSIRFEFSSQICDAEKSFDIRISLSGDGSWSQVGTKAKFITPTIPTMQISGVSGDAIATASERRTILHEFGHALGFEHEHQSVPSGCKDEFDWDYLYATFGPGLSTDRNFETIGDGLSMSGIYVTNFDRDSIMIYALPETAFKQGERSKCFVPVPPEHLSKVDIETVQAMYK